MIEAEFDALGRRRKKTVGGTDVVLYYYDGEHVVEEYDGSDNLLRKFVNGQRMDEIRVMIAPDVADVDDDQNTTEVLEFYYHHDNLGSVTHITGPGRSVVEQYEYLPYGGTTIKDGSGNDLSGQSAIGNPYMFTARRFEEETGLYHYRRRACDPETGRFLQRDPLGYVDGDCIYEYAQSSPTALADPLGLLAAKTEAQQAAYKRVKDALDKAVRDGLIGPEMRDWVLERLVWRQLREIFYTDVDIDNEPYISCNTSQLDDVGIDELLAMLIHELVYCADFRRFYRWWWADHWPREPEWPGPTADQVHGNEINAYM